MATDSSILAWEIPWTEEPSGLQSIGSQELDTTEWLDSNNKCWLWAIGKVLCGMRRTSIVTCAWKSFVLTLSSAYIWFFDCRFKQWKNTSYIRSFMEPFSCRVLSFSQVRKCILMNSFNISWTVGYQNKVFDKLLGCLLTASCWFI